MRWFLFSLFMVIVSLSACGESGDTVIVTRIDTVYINTAPADSMTAVNSWAKRIERYNRFWERLCPRGGRIQFAGNMGMFSAGPCWIYGREHWETALLFGFVPRHQARHGMMTMTIKEDYIPWSIHFHGKRRDIDFQPLATGIYFNTVFDHKFWTKQPDRYPKGYYWFSTRMRPNIYIGERLKLHIPYQRRRFGCAVSLFYEISASDFDIIQQVQNSYLTPGKYLTLSLGIQVEWF